MTEYNLLRHRLTRLLEKTSTAEALGPASWWEGDAAGERRVRDDKAAGRLAWREAHRAARKGIAALASDDLQMAETYAWVATDHYMAALEARIRPSDLELLWRPASSRGRKKAEK